MTITDKEFSVSTDPQRLDLGFIHAFLSKEAYWCPGIPFDTVKKSVENSLNFGLYHQDQQIGYARIITDYARFAYLADVFVIPAWRGRGLSKFLMKQVMAHPDLQGLRRWMLVTSDAHGLYRQFGWNPVGHPERYMELSNENVYDRTKRNE